MVVSSTTKAGTQFVNPNKLVEAGIYDLGDNNDGGIIAVYDGNGNNNTNISAAMYSNLDNTGSLYVAGSTGTMASK